MKVAFVYDRVNKFGGAERLLLVLHEIWPEAPIYTAVYNPKTAKWAKVFKVYPSFLNKLPFAKTWHEIYPWLMPIAFESFDFSGYDVVISVTSAEAKGIITKPETLHICYCLTPTRYLWSGEKDYLENPGFGMLNFLARQFVRPVFRYLKRWDLVACSRPDYYLAISENVKKRIKKYYDKDSEVIYPPVGLKRNWRVKIENQGKYFLVVSRLVSYKKVDLVVKVFNKLGEKLKIVGTGREMGRLKKMAKGNIDFLGELTDKELLRYYQESRALIMPQAEDFGLVSLEAQSFGKPVIAFGKGGGEETVINGKTGVLFNLQNEEALLQAIKKFEQMEISPLECIKNAEKYDKEDFMKKFKKKVLEKYQQYKEEM